MYSNWSFSDNIIHDSLAHIISYIYIYIYIIRILKHLQFYKYDKLLHSSWSFMSIHHLQCEWTIENANSNHVFTFTRTQEMLLQCYLIIERIKLWIGFHCWDYPLLLWLEILCLFWSYFVFNLITHDPQTQANFTLTLSHPAVNSE